MLIWGGRVTGYVESFVVEFELEEFVPGPEFCESFGDP